ncbi:RNA helicase [Lentinula detonsa]|uniref:RNA helicase n=1 Tax=Lentinula detonsa TaxID=2804962 RepID=A0AA38PQM1_9AGAR|nr:RNA helicase [Lentinula detonsa]
MAPSTSNYCYDSLEERGCPRGSACNLQHDIIKCSCGLVLRRLNFHNHVKGKRHVQLSRRAGSSSRLTFPIVEETQPSPNNSSSSESAFVRCSRCSKRVEQSQIHDHLKAHDIQERLDSAFEIAESNKHGFTIDGLGCVDFGIVGEDQKPVVRLRIIRESEPQPPIIRLSKCRLLSSSRNDKHGDGFSVELIGSPYINPGRPRTLLVTFHPSNAGRYEDRLELVFRNQATKTRFVIHRSLVATVGDKNDHNQLQPSAPYTRRKRVPLRIDGPIRHGLRPPTWTKTKWVTVLPKFDVSRQITDILYKRGAKSKKDILVLIRELLPPEFNLKTYGSRFQSLLFLEEEQMKQDLDAYAMEGVSLRPKHPRYELEVQGLAEGRPSVLVGDFILVRQEHATDQTWFQGRVHQVYENYVSLRFDDSFSTYRGNSFEVRFVLNRLSLRRMHAALVNRNNPARLLFPGPEHIRNMRRTSFELIDKITPINRVIGQDPEQLQAVAAIVNMPPGSPPFVIFGPPGTGKTVTLVEAMQQLLANNKATRLLVCAPSNSAADLITDRLSVLGPSVILRLNSLSRKFSELPKHLCRFSITNDNEVFAMPTVDDLRKYRVVVSTCMTAGVPASLGIERGYYSHIFVDEAGQAMEPTVMVPLKELADAKTNVVLAGDNKQLGPIVHSGLASVLGLKTSYLARVMDREIYDLDGKSSIGGRGLTIIKLVRNFRSHPDILEFSNEHFYNHELQYCGDPMLTRSLENSDELPRKKFPLIFHGIVGKDQREASSPSFFNIEEASLVKKYCLSLISDRKNGIRAEHIAVITPYHAQRIKILNLLSRQHTTREIKVGSVEEFQGQEKRIVIISTVRSSTNFIGADISRMLGFVANPHRFNVAVTRAQALLIVIGNPMVLSLDPLWRSFLNYIYRGGGWRGKTISWDPAGVIDPNNGREYELESRQRAASEAEEAITRLKALIIRKNEEIEDGFQFDLDTSDDEDGNFGFGEGPVFREED